MKIGNEENHKRGLPMEYVKTHLLPNLQMCFFIGLILFANNYNYCYN